MIAIQTTSALDASAAANVQPRSTPEFPARAYPPMMKLR